MKENTHEYILDLADKAARVVLGGRRWATAEDWEDATQAAAAEIVGVARPDVGEGYLFNVARKAIYEWLRTWLRHPRGGTILDFLDYSEQPDAPRPPLDLDALAPLLLAARGKRHGFAAHHIQEEIDYLRLLLDGRSIEGIGMEMGLSRRRVYALRERVLPRLERIAARH